MNEQVKPFPEDTRVAVGEEPSISLDELLAVRNGEAAQTVEAQEDCPVDND